MGQNGFKMNILWPKQFQRQTCKYQKTYFNKTDGEYVFRIGKRNLPGAPWTAG